MNPASPNQKCVVVGETLLISKCPLEKGACTWQHRKHDTCMYSSDFDSNLPSPQAIAVRVGAKIPSDENVEHVSQRIITLFKESAK